MDKLPAELQERIWRTYMSTYVIPQMVHQVIDCDIEDFPDGMCPELGDISAKTLCPTQSAFATLAWNLGHKIWYTWDGPYPPTSKYNVWWSDFLERDPDHEPDVLGDVSDITVDVRNLEWDAVLLFIRGFNGACTRMFKSKRWRWVRNVKLHRFPDGTPHWITCEFRDWVTYSLGKPQSCTCRFESWKNMDALDGAVMRVRVGLHNNIWDLYDDVKLEHPPDYY